MNSPKIVAISFVKTVAEKKKKDEPNIGSFVNNICFLPTFTKFSALLNKQKKELYIILLLFQFIFALK